LFPSLLKVAYAAALLLCSTSTILQTLKTS
jgi:hypothetical protein